MILLSTFAILLLTQSTVAQTINSSLCSCYLTNGTSSGYFTSRTFFDYRNIPNVSPTTPTLLPNITNTTNAPATSDFFTSHEFSDFWAVQNWDNSGSRATTDSTVLMANSPNNIYIELSNDSLAYNTYLTLRTARLPTFQSAAELDSVAQNYQHLSLRILARVLGSPGACAGIFTYRPSSNPQDVQEADIEILTSGPRNDVQYTNQPSVSPDGDVIPQATANVTNPGGVDWTEWNMYRVDWMPGKTTWYVNGEPVAEISFQAPRDPAGLILNMWSNGGSWTGNMSVYDEAYLQVQWVEVVYNTSDPAVERDEGLENRRETSGCEVACSVDESVNVTGSPVVLWNSTGIGPMPLNARGMASMGWISILVVGAVALRWI